MMGDDDVHFMFPFLPFFFYCNDLSQGCHELKAQTVVDVKRPIPKWKFISLPTQFIRISILSVITEE